MMPVDNFLSRNGRSFVSMTWDQFHGEPQAEHDYRNENECTPGVDFCELSTEREED